MPRPTLAAALLAFSSLASAQELVPDKAIEIELKATDTVLEGHGPSRSFEYDVTFEGTLYIWAASKNLDPILRVTDSDGELLVEDDNSGGGTTAYIALAVSRNELPSITVAAADANAMGRLVLHVSEAPEGDASDLTPYLALLRKSSAARAAGDYATARAMVSEAVASLLARPESEHDAAWIKLLYDAGRQAYDSGSLRTADRAWQCVFEIYSRTLPDDHPELQNARQCLAVTTRGLGNLSGARALEEKVLEVRARTLADDDPQLQKARGNLAATYYALGDIKRARPLFEKVLQVDSRTLPDDHPDLQSARQAFGAMIQAGGDLAGARALFEKVLEVRSRTLPGDHPEVQDARQNLASVLYELGDLANARVLFEKELAVHSRTLPDDHPNLQRTRLSLAAAVHDLGDFDAARVLLEKALDVNSRTLPDDHPDLQTARTNLAVTMSALGDEVGARKLFEKVLEVDSRKLPDDHPDLQRVRGNLAATLSALGDLAGARALEENVLEVQSRTLPDDHPNLQSARYNLGTTLLSIGDLASARALFEKTLEVNSRTLADEHPDMQLARLEVADCIARQQARSRWEARARGEAVEGSEKDRERCADLIAALCRAQIRGAKDAIIGRPAREAEERCWRFGPILDRCLSFASGIGVFEPLRVPQAESFILGETTRGAAIVSAELSRKAARSSKYRELRSALEDASDHLARHVRNGTTSEEFDRARMKRESVEREILLLAGEPSGGKKGGLAFDVESLAASLGDREAAIAFRRFTKFRLDVIDELDGTGESAVSPTSVDTLCAFVVRSSTPNAGGDSPSSPKLTYVDLGPIASIAEDVRAWRDGLGVGSDSRGAAVGTPAEPTTAVLARGLTLRAKIFDPLLPVLVGTQRIVVALDDILDLVPIDALPLDGTSLLGEHWQVATRLTLTELLDALVPTTDSGTLVAFGDIEYGTSDAPHATSTATQSADVGATPRASEDAGILRGSAWSGGFPELPGTGAEVGGIARCFGDQLVAGVPAELCEHASATRERLLVLAPKARWLHIATHGWFAPESIRSWSDAGPLDAKTGLAMRMSSEEQVKGMSPMLLCGLALAGANLPENELGRVPGLITADEISTLDLSSCELAVLSACDTNVGERRPGQGVHSLQMALQMAGARSVITSLWKVPDEATKELMVDFYQRMWVEKKPKWQALWEAKMKLRNAKDEQGRPLYSTRDWAAWVLTGDPN